MTGQSQGKPKSDVPSKAETQRPAAGDAPEVHGCRMLPDIGTKCL